MSSCFYTNRFNHHNRALRSKSVSNNKLANVHSKWYRARWLLLLVFVGGYLATFSIFEPIALEYLVFTIISIFACSLLLTRLNPPLVNKLPIWIILAVFILAFYIKFYLMVWNPDIMPLGLFRRLQWIIKSPEILLNTYATMTYAFVTFCLTSWWLLVYKKIPRFRSFKREINYRRIFPVLMWLIPFLMIVTTLVMYVTGISRMAAESVYLPFHLAGWIFYIRTTLIPVLLLLLIWCSDKAGSRKHLILGILLLFLHGLSDMLLRSSRGSLLMMFIMLMLLFIVTRQITKQRIRLFAIILLMTMLLWPVISAYRYIRAGSYSVSIGDSLSESINSISSYGSISVSETFSEAIKSVLFRFVGVDSLLPIVESGIQPLGVDAFNISVTKFVTVEVFGFSPDAPVAVAPSLPGWFYIVGGNYLVIAGMFCFVLFIWVTWRTLLKSRLRCLPVAQTLFLFFVFRISSSGTLGSLYLKILVIGGSVTVCEWIVRTIGTASVSKNVGISGSKGLRDASGAM